MGVASISREKRQIAADCPAENNANEDKRDAEKNQFHDCALSDVRKRLDDEMPKQGDD
jgi:hypothetical protein